MALAKFTRRELEGRNRRGNVALVIDNLVYDVSEFLDDHPGGVEVLLDNGGRDASQCFHDVGHSELALEWRQKFLVGEVVDEERREPVCRAAPGPGDEPAEPRSLWALLAAGGPPLLLALLAALVYAYLLQ